MSSPLPRPGVVTRDCGVKRELVKSSCVTVTRDERQPCARVGPDCFGTEIAFRERSKYLRLWKDILGYATSRKLRAILENHFTVVVAMFNSLNASALFKTNRNASCPGKDSFCRREMASAAHSAASLKGAPPAPDPKRGIAMKMALLLVKLLDCKESNRSSTPRAAPLTMASTDDK